MQGLLWHDEELCKAARDYVRANAVVKGRPSLKPGRMIGRRPGEYCLRRD